MNTDGVLARHCVGIAKTFGIGTGVVCDSEYILCLEVDACICHAKLADDIGRERVAEREGLQAQERAVLDVEL